MYLPKEETMRVLLIGGTGLISTAITRLLLEQGKHDVILYNRNKTELRLPAPVKTIAGDRTNFPQFEEQMAAAGNFDCVIDMCCYLPAEAASAIRALRGRVGQYIFTSTVDVYSKPAAHYPITEAAARNPSPTFAYAYEKAKCEALILAAHSNDFPITIIRPAYTYGESRGILHSFRGRTTYIDRIRKGKPIVVHGDGQSLWGSCHIDDVARAFVHAVGNPITHGRAYHVTGEEWLTWNQHHQQVAEALGAPPPTLIHIPSTLLAKAAPDLAAWSEFNFQYNNIFDNSAAHRDLDFRYTIPWKEGVRRTVAWLDAHDGVEDSANEAEYDRLIAAWQQASEDMVQALAE